MSPPTASGPDPQLSSDLVVEAVRLVRSVRRRHQLPAGHRVLSLLDEQGPTGISALAALDDTSQPTMSAAVAQLAGQDLVAKQPHPADRRSSVVVLTDEGRAALARVRAQYARDVSDQLAAAGVSAERLIDAVEVLRAAVLRTYPDPEALEGQQ